MKDIEISEKISDQSEAIDIIAKELIFLLTEAQKHTPQLGTPLADELARRFMSLYEDFKKVRQNAINLSQEVEKIKFKDHTIGLVYKATTQLLVRKMSEGLFAQFISVAEYGCLPDGTTFDNEDDMI